MKGIVKKVKITGSKPVKAGKKLKLKAKVTATKKANTKLLWTSGNAKYATVNAKGIVTTKKSAKGKTVKITAMATDGSGKKHTVKIKIKLGNANNRYLLFRSITSTLSLNIIQKRQYSTTMLS